MTCHVSTAPHLQSVGKKLQCDEINSTFKELKFLTPVRRSRQLQDKISKPPDTFKDYYPCAPSLGQLTDLADDSGALMCRSVPGALGEGTLEIDGAVIRRRKSKWLGALCSPKSLTPWQAA